MSNIRPVILCGGIGSRLWPFSRATYPKQLHPLLGERSLLQEAILRLNAREKILSPLVIANTDYRFILSEQLQEINVIPEAIILEPEGRNTMAAATVAALVESASSQNILLLLPADHFIHPADNEMFYEIILQASQLALDGNIVMLGIQPKTPHTGYGYIEHGELIGEMGNVYQVKSFTEKPSKDIAENYLRTKQYFWNSGIFLFRADILLEEVERQHPEIFNNCQAAVSKAANDLEFIRLDKDSFIKCENISIDYAIMEKTRKAVVIPASFRWHDIGSWGSLWDIAEKDQENNVCKGDVIISNVKNSYLHAGKRMLVAHDVEDIVVVETPDAVLVTNRANTENIKTIIAELSRQKRVEMEKHLKCFRPWGYYETLDRGPFFQVKHIMVKPGARLSLQLHHHRAEHWIVISGAALIQNGEEEKLLGPNESTFVPMGVKHRIANAGNVPLHIIEVQSGAYLEEDDIERFADDYKREIVENEQ